MATSMIFVLTIFTYFAAIGLIFSLVWTFKPNQAYKMLSMAAGLDLNQLATVNEATSRAMNFLLIDFTSQMSGFNFFALLILWFPYRAGESWAWFALWFYPLMFAWHYMHYAKGTKFSKVQIIYCLISALTLLWAYSDLSN